MMSEVGCQFDHFGITALGSPVTRENVQVSYELVEE